MAKVTTVWADSVLRKVAGWIKVPVETTIFRVFKHALRDPHWRHLLRSGKPKQWVDVAIRRLRRKVDDAFEHKLIHTVRGIGYVFEKR